MKKYSFDDCPDSPFIPQIPAVFSPAIRAQSSFIVFTKNEYLNHEGATFDYLYLILSGKTKVLRNEPNGKQRIVQFLTQGDYIGDLALVQGETRSSDILAISEVWTFAIPQKIAHESLFYDVAFLQMLAQHIAQKLLFRTDHFAKSQSFELKYRLAMLLVETANDELYDENHSQIADYLGVSYRHLIHTFKWLKDQQYIIKLGKSYQIDSHKLHQLIQEGSDL